MMPALVRRVCRAASRPERLRVLLAAALLSSPAAAQAQSSGGAPAPPATPAAARPAPCDAGEYHQFDFWLGRWKVTLPDGRVAGTNHIERLPGGCVLQEHWLAARGGPGTSLNFYDRAGGQWHQVWVDAQGGVLRLTGGRQGQAMVLTGTAPGANGEAVQQRITWSPLSGGRVRQLWETSSDGKTWQVAFDGTYARDGG